MQVSKTGTADLHYRWRLFFRSRFEHFECLVPIAGFESTKSRRCQRKYDEFRRTDLEKFWCASLLNDFPVTG